MSRDVLIIGGGVIGLCAAYYTARRDDQVVVLDCNPEQRGNEENVPFQRREDAAPFSDVFSFLRRYSEGRQPIHLVNAFEKTKGL